MYYNSLPLLDMSVEIIIKVIKRKVAIFDE